MNLYLTSTDWNSSSQCYWTMDYSPAVWSSAPPQEMICSICSDKAEGYHFGAISCAACGAFFRRSVSDQKVYSCSNRQCNITHDPTKRGGSCRFCRFLKCVTSGMMPQDVKAKRTSSSSQNSQSLHKTMNPSSVQLIDEILMFRHRLAAERQHFEVMPSSANRTTLILSMHREFEMLRRVCLGCPFFVQITEHLHIPFVETGSKMMNDPLGDILLLLYVFEACLQTGARGGLQLDRLVLPNMLHVDLSDIAFNEFLECDIQTNIDPFRHIQDAFGNLVRNISRLIQPANFDEPILCILLYKCMTETIPINYRHRFAEVNRDSLLTDLNRVDSMAFRSIQDAAPLIHHGTHRFKEAIANLS
ncbi:hypothetical protein L3Y34_003386 [Caenorhabditis briggsae]|uniref:Nuclear receptor domain-containing protein n=1 Tax=Caenorhabditis briggsae TaxID=6238 RepID=A0AAE9AAA7_CAEBR|nr:hypothetical protein L3Y34_003386 [Caenorhabditis briggsae]